MDEIAPNKHQLDSWKGPKEEWEVKVAKYPSLKKLDDQGEEAVEVCVHFFDLDQAILMWTSHTMVAKHGYCSSLRTTRIWSR